MCLTCVHPHGVTQPDFIDRQNSAVRDGREEEETEDSMWNAMSTVRDDTPSKKKPRTE